MIGRLIFLFVLAPVGAAVVVTALLLFGAPAHLVFAPGWAVLALLRRGGLHPPNGVGVASTVILWWVVIAAIGLAWERRRKRA